MDSQGNPVFFNTFDPFDNPAPPKQAPPASNPIPSNSNNHINNNNNDNVNSNILLPAGSHNPHFFPSPLDSPSINPYPLPRSSSSNSWANPSYGQSVGSTQQPQPPAYNSSGLGSSFSSAPTPTSTPNSSVSNSASPVNSPSLSSVHSYNSQQSFQLNSQPQSQQPQPQSPIQSLHSQSASPAPSPSPSPYSNSQTPPPQAQPQVYQAAPYAQYPQQYKPYQTPQPTSPTPQHQPQQPQPSQPPQLPTSSSQSQLQQTPATPQYTPPQPTASASSQALPEAAQKMLEQIVGSINTVMTRLDGIDNRISALEIATKEVLNNQRTISTQQRKLQDYVDTPKMVPAPVAQVHHVQPVPHYEEPRKPTPMYQPPSMPTSAGPIMPPPPSHHMPSLVPVTHISNRGERISSVGSGGAASYDADLELAKKLQAEFDNQPSSTPAASNTNSNSYSVSKPTPTPSVSASKSGQQECPICSTRVAIADLEAHVEQHFEDEESKRPSKPGEKPAMTKTEAKGFLSKLFGPKEEEKKPGNTETQAATATPTAAATATATAQTNVPYTHTAYNQRSVGYYPTMGPTPQQAAMYRQAYYPYP